jgi:alpha-acetolactate decarboxylase
MKKESKMQKFEKPVYMLVEDVQKHYYPNSVVMINCEMKYFAPISGYIVGVASGEGSDNNELKAYHMELIKDGKNGEVHFIKTQNR